MTDLLQSVYRDPLSNLHGVSAHHVVTSVSEESREKTELVYTSDVKHKLNEC